MNITSAEFIKGIRGADPLVYDGVSQAAFVGRSNVGKSSLIAAVTRRNNLVKVSKTPGKTTEINFFHINRKFYLVDLPGYGYARVNPAEKEKLKKLIIWYLTEANIRPKIVVLVLDVKAGVTTFDEQMMEILRDQQHPFVVVVNKTDKLTKKDLATQLKNIREAAGDAEVITTCAVKAGGANDLLKKLSDFI